VKGISWRKRTFLHEQVFWNSLFGWFHRGILKVLSWNLDSCKGLGCSYIGNGFCVSIRKTRIKIAQRYFIQIANNAVWNDFGKRSGEPAFFFFPGPFPPTAEGRP
jgi:hypothetical protein